MDAISLSIFFFIPILVRLNLTKACENYRYENQNENIFLSTTKLFLISECYSPK